MKIAHPPSASASPRCAGGRAIPTCSFATPTGRFRPYMHVIEGVFLLCLGALVRWLKKACWQGRSRRTRGVLRGRLPSCWILAVGSPTPQPLPPLASATTTSFAPTPYISSGLARTVACVVVTHSEWIDALWVHVQARFAAKPAVGGPSRQAYLECPHCSGKRQRHLVRSVAAQVVEFGDIKLALSSFVLEECAGATRKVFVPVEHRRSSRDQAPACYQNSSPPPLQPLPRKPADRGVAPTPGSMARD